MCSEELLPKVHRASGAGGGAHSGHKSGFSVERDLKATVVLEIFCRKLVKGDANIIELRCVDGDEGFSPCPGQVKILEV